VRLVISLWITRENKCQFAIYDETNRLWLWFAKPQFIHNYKFTRVVQRISVHLDPFSFSAPSVTTNRTNLVNFCFINMMTITFHMFKLCNKKSFFQLSYVHTTNLWWDFDNDAIRKVYILYNNLFRIVLGYETYCIASEMFVYNNWFNCAVVMINFTYRFKCKLQLSKNITNYWTVAVLSDVTFWSRIWTTSSIPTTYIS